MHSKVNKINDKVGHHKYLICVPTATKYIRITRSDAILEHGNLCAFVERECYSISDYYTCILQSLKVYMHRQRAFCTITVHLSGLRTFSAVRVLALLHWAQPFSSPSATSLLAGKTPSLESKNNLDFVVQDTFALELSRVNSTSPK